VEPARLRIRIPGLGATADPPIMTPKNGYLRAAGDFWLPLAAAV